MRRATANKSAATNTGAPATRSTSTSGDFGRNPDGGGRRSSAAPTGTATATGCTPRWTTRLAYTEILTDETAPTGAAFLLRAAPWFAARGTHH
ncbi:hypothetical protein Arub01_57850 [Actinomadura rubrobrunea]|uniref:Uncharacterized protein n=1 Tax=Actinomadura rubrobrunea TaxID=115335 RepID=A0A9W6Q3J7_9ACTN|nr:hypothetical protein Arub01_57850 [Actinomadura rubrobrunea]